MMKPAIQNDFSYYRRSMGKRELDELTVSSEDANTISLFLAASSPMINVLTKVWRAVGCMWSAVACGQSVAPIKQPIQCRHHHV